LTLIEQNLYQITIQIRQTQVALLKKVDVLEKDQMHNHPCNQESSSLNALDHMNWAEEIDSMYIEPSQTIFTITKEQWEI
jgi:hypothetical protein